jgi:AcrR family transcriptional regulator
MDKSERRIQFNRQNILDVAKKLFLSKGVEKTTMDDIAQVADYSKSTIYVYYKSKDDIYYHVVYEYINLLHEGIKNCIATSIDVETCYYAICQTLVELEQSYPMYFDCVLGKISVDQKAFEELPILREIYEVGEEINVCVAAFFERGSELGYFKKSIKPLPTMFIIWASICSLISVSTSKEEYFMNSLSMKRAEFLRYGFEMLLNSIREVN